MRQAVNRLCNQRISYKSHSTEIGQNEFVSSCVLLRDQSWRIKCILYWHSQMRSIKNLESFMWTLPRRVALISWLDIFSFLKVLNWILNICKSYHSWTFFGLLQIHLYTWSCFWWLKIGIWSLNHLRLCNLTCKTSSLEVLIAIAFVHEVLIFMHW
jgi:hypothetical protein